MKKIALILSIVTFLCINLFAQSTKDESSTDYKNAIYVFPLESFFNVFQVGYERELFDNKQSILISASAYLEFSQSEPFSGYSEEIQYKFFLNNPDISKTRKDKSINKFYFGLLVNHKRLINFNDRSNNTFCAGVTTGYKRTYGRFAVDIYIGSAYKFSEYGDTPNVENPYGYNYKLPPKLYDTFKNFSSGIVPKFGLNLGFCF